MSTEQPNTPYEFPSNSSDLIEQVTSPSVETADPEPEPDPGEASRGAAIEGAIPYEPHIASEDLGGTCPRCGGRMETFVRASYDDPGSVSLKLFGQCLRSCGYRPSGTLETVAVAGGL